MTGRYARLDSGNPDSILKFLKSVNETTQGLEVWLAIQSYVAQTFAKFVSNLEPLTRYASEAVAPFEGSGDPLPGWYRAAVQKIPNEEAVQAEALWACHLKENVLGDSFVESSIVIEPVNHIALLAPDLVSRHLESMQGELAGKKGNARDRTR